MIENSAILTKDYATTDIYISCQCATHRCEFYGRIESCPCLKPK